MDPGVEDRATIREASMVAGVVVGSLVLAILLLVGMRLLGVDPASLRYSSFQPSVANVGLGFAVYTILVAAILAAQRWLAREPLSALGADRSLARFLAIGLCLGVVIAIVAKGLVVLVSPGTRFLLSTPSSATSWGVAVSISMFFLVVNSLHEELVFRAFPLSKFRQRPQARWIAILLLSVVFSLIHFSTSAASAAAFCTRFGMGVFLSLLFLRTGSLGSVVGVHSGLNLVSWQLSGNVASGALGSFVAPAAVAAQWINAGVIAVAAIVVWRFPGRAAR